MTERIKQEDRQYIANTYGRFDLLLTRGKGAKAWDDAGKEYIDMGAGIAVNTFGYGDDEWVRAVTDQLGRLQRWLGDAGEMGSGTFSGQEPAAEHVPDTMSVHWSKYAPAYSMKAEVYMLQKDTAKAIAALDKSLEIDPYDGSTWTMRSIISLARKEWKDAEGYLDKETELGPLAELRRRHLRQASTTSTPVITTSSTSTRGSNGMRSTSMRKVCKV